MVTINFLGIGPLLPSVPPSMIGMIEDWSNCPSSSYFSRLSFRNRKVNNNTSIIRYHSQPCHWSTSLQQWNPGHTLWCGTLKTVVQVKGSRVSIHEHNNQWNTDFAYRAHNTYIIFCCIIITTTKPTLIKVWTMILNFAEVSWHRS